VYFRFQNGDKHELLIVVTCEYIFLDFFGSFSLGDGSVSHEAGLRKRERERKGKRRELTYSEDIGRRFVSEPFNRTQRRLAATDLTLNPPGINGRLYDLVSGRLGKLERLPFFF
jgi:hypothetical protein